MRNIVFFVLFVGACVGGYLWYNNALKVQVDQKKVAEEVAISPYTSAKALFESLQYSAAYDKYKEALATDPKNPEAVSASYAIGKCLQEMGRKADAVEAYKNFVKNYPQDDRVNQAQKQIDLLSAGV